MNLDTWLLFATAALVVIVIPGPLSLLMVSNSLNLGIARAWPAFVGGVSASLCLLSASALGLGALLAASATVFGALKLAGAVYLFYLAWASWRQARAPASEVAPNSSVQTGFASLFGRAFALGASNPKDILFFAAFLPQFISPEVPMGAQLGVMIATWAALDLCCKLGYGLLARSAGGYLRSGRGQQWFNRASAALFATAGTAALLSQR